MAVLATRVHRAELAFSHLPLHPHPHPHTHLVGVLNSFEFSVLSFFPVPAIGAVISHEDFPVAQTALLHLHTAHCVGQALQAARSGAAPHCSLLPGLQHSPPVCTLSPRPAFAFHRPSPLQAWGWTPLPISPSQSLRMCSPAQPALQSLFLQLSNWSFGCYY